MEDVGYHVVDDLEEEAGNHVVTYLSVVDVLLVVVVVARVVVLETWGLFLFLFFFFLSFNFCFFHHSNLLLEETLFLSRILDLNFVSAAPPS